MGASNQPVDDLLSRESAAGFGTEVEIKEVAVFDIASEFFAIEDVSTHDDGKLAEGDIEGYEIVWRRHGARFDLRTGKITAPPAYEDVTTL